MDPFKRLMKTQQEQLDAAANAANASAAHEGWLTQHPRELMHREQSALARVNPWRSRWPELRELEARVTDLEARQRQVTDEITALHEQSRTAPARDADALAAWELSGRNGTAPTPQAHAIEQALSAKQAHHEGLTLAIDTVLSEKTAFVVKHRDRLLKDAVKDQDAALRAHRDAIDTLAATREELAHCHDDVLWAQTFPDAAASQKPPTHLIACGLAKPLANTLGISSQVAADRLLDLLRTDAELVCDAATPAQQAAIGATNDRDGAVWSDSDEGKQREREEREAELRAYVEMWGKEPA